MRVIALDVGGANLKAAHTTGVARSVAFELWKRPDELPRALQEVVAALPAAELLAVTMTAELCDCFRTKRDGVAAVLSAVAHLADNLGGLPVRVWQSDGSLVDVEQARAEPAKTAAANWLALATLVGRWCGGTSGVLLDIGSTTTDVIPIQAGRPAPRGRTDTERLRTGELVYTGVRRTPICAVVPEVPWRGAGCGVSAELFATTLDAYLMLGDIAEDAEDRTTADGRPATREFAWERLARVICADRESVTAEDARALALAVAAAQRRQIERALSRVSSQLHENPGTIVISGSGEFLARRLAQAACGLETEIISVRDRLGAEVSAAACAYALSVLAGEEWRVESRDSKPSTVSEQRPVVLKVGGSLLDLAGLGRKLRRWIDQTCGRQVIVVAGGGEAAEMVRRLDERHQLGQERSHDLALRAMELNGHLLESVLPQAQVVTKLSECAAAWAAGMTPILNPRELLAQTDRGQAATLPHNWSVTSDSIAAWLARCAGADELVLLKSASLPDSAPLGIEDVVRSGVVDRYFSLAAAGLSLVRLVNFRSRPPRVHVIALGRG